MKLHRAMWDDNAANPEVVVTSDLVGDNSLMWMTTMYVLPPILINIISTIKV